MKPHSTMPQCNRQGCLKGLRRCLPVVAVVLALTPWAADTATATGTTAEPAATDRPAEDRPQPEAVDRSKAEPKVEPKAEPKTEPKAEPKAEPAGEKAPDATKSTDTAPDKAEPADRPDAPPPTNAEPGDKTEKTEKADKPKDAELPVAGRTKITKGTFRRVIGSEVSSGKTDIVVATIANILVDVEGRPIGAVLDYGGFMGVGKRRIAVDWSMLDFSGNKILLGLTRDQLKEFPDYKDGEDAVLATTPAAN